MKGMNEEEMGGMNKKIKKDKGPANHFSVLEGRSHC